MKVSIIIPVFNVAAFIKDCLLSALNQTWDDLEIILVNDATPDNSMEIVSDILKNHSRRNDVKICTHSKNGGIAAARNTGIRNASGDYLYFMDSDDYLPLDSIESLASEAQKWNVDVVIGEYQLIGFTYSVPSKLSFTGLLEERFAVINSYAKGEWPVMPWNKLVRSNLVKSENLFFDESIVHEDDLWSFLLACKANNAYAIRKPTYYYVLHPNSFMGKFSFRKLESRVKIIDIIYNFILSSEVLKNNRSIYIFYETLKAKYFDRIIYYTKDKTFCFQAYCLFREEKYISPFKALIKFHPNIKLNIRNIHYLLPKKVGYLYFKTFVKLSYYFLVLPIKFRQWTTVDKH